MFDSIIEYLKNPSVRNVAILISVIVIFRVFFNYSENFTSQENADSALVLEKNMSQEDIPIQPTYFDSDVRSIMSGSGFIPQHDISGPFGMEPNVNNYGIIDGLDDGQGGSLGLHHNLVSPACCSEQWPVPFKLKEDKFICNNKDKFVPSPFMGNNAWQNSGCLCMPSSTAKFLSDRGGNA